MAKLCALVSMQRMVGPTVQSFSLPMQLVTQEPQVREKKRDRYLNIVLLCDYRVVQEVFWR